MCGLRARATGWSHSLFCDRQIKIGSDDFGIGNSASASARTPRSRRKSRGRCYMLPWIARWSPSLGALSWKTFKPDFLKK